MARSWRSFNWDISCHFLPKGSSQEGQISYSNSCVLSGTLCEVESLEPFALLTKGAVHPLRPMHQPGSRTNLYPFAPIADIDLRLVGQTANGSIPERSSARKTTDWHLHASSSAVGECRCFHGFPFAQAYPSPSSWRLGGGTLRIHSCQPASLCQRRVCAQRHGPLGYLQ